MRVVLDDGVVDEIDHRHAGVKGAQVQAHHGIRFDEIPGCQKRETFGGFGTEGDNPATGGFESTAELGFFALRALRDASDQSVFARKESHGLRGFTPVPCAKADGGVVDDSMRLGEENATRATRFRGIVLRSLLHWIRSLRGERFHGRFEGTIHRVRGA